MTTARRMCSGLALVALIGASAAQAGEAPPVMQPALATRTCDEEGLRLNALSQKTRHALVSVLFTVIGKRGDQTQRAGGVLTGVVLDGKGLVMTLGEMYPRTADRVVGSAMVEPPSGVKVILADGKEVEATFLGKDYDLNLCFVRMKDPPATVAPLPPAEKGSLVLGQSLTLFSLLPKHYGRGIWFEPSRISALITEPRELYVATGLEARMLGGAAVDEQGRLAGFIAVDTRSVRAEFEPEGPLRQLSSVVVVPAWVFSPLIANPPTVRPAKQDGWLGIVMDPLTKDLAEALKLPATGGVMVGQVYRGTPAEKGGLKTEDVIVAIDGKPLTVTSDEQLTEFRKQIVAAGAGAKLAFTVIRGGKKQDIVVTLEPTPISADETARLKLDDFAFTARDLVFTDRMAPGRPADLSGVIVVAVEAGGWAGLGGLRPGDIVQRVGEKPVKTLDEFKTAIEAARKEKAKEVVLFVLRGAETAFVRIEPQWK